MKKGPVTSPREAALLALSAVERQGAWAETFLKKTLRDAGLSVRDSALATRLTFGVLQSRLLIDYYIGRFSTVKVSKMELFVLNALRLGIFQMVFLDKIPVSAAVNESVAMTRNYSKNPRASGLVNAVLRQIARQLDHLPEVNTGDYWEDLSIQTSHPKWLVEEFKSELEPSALEAFLQWNNLPPEIMAQVNTVNTNKNDIISSLELDGVSVTPHPWMEGCLTLSGTGDLEKLSAYINGDFYIQDAAARLAAEVSGVKAGMRVLDACAAPGGKSFAAAILMQNIGEVVSCDIHPHKIKLMEAGAKRLGLSCVNPQLLDGTTPKEQFFSSFDAVIADVPCSGLGIMRKKPDIRYKDPVALDELPVIQKKILNNVSSYVKHGGVLIYSTCTLRRSENEDIVASFLNTHPEFSAEPFSLPNGMAGGENGMCTLWPQIYNTDGFFVAKMRRKE
jgi:16S rRNA (cytosine967-C5)-methyltransferase